MLKHPIPGMHACLCKVGGYRTRVRGANLHFIPGFKSTLLELLGRIQQEDQTREKKMRGY